MKLHLGNLPSALVILCVAVLIDNPWSMKSAGILLLQILLFTAFRTQAFEYSIMLSVHLKLFLDGPNAAVIDESR